MWRTARGKKIYPNIKVYGNIAKYFLKIKELTIRSTALIKWVELQNNYLQ